MQTDQPDTIIALSSGQGRSGISVFRISGPKADLFLETYTKAKLPAYRMAALRWLFNDAGEKLDQALVLRFKTPDSFTGEDCIELHCHGSPAIAEEIIRLALRLDGFRLAERGEFSKRAFENEKLDLIQAEGIGDLIEADTTKQLYQAARFVAGDASTILEKWRKEILEISALIAASIDFSDEGDVGEAVHAPASEQISALILELERHLDQSKQAARIRDGIRIAILGEPNVGKSTLMNALAGREAAIVSDIAGTTRDILEVHLVLAGIPVLMADTAGLRETDDPIEKEGVRRARDWAEKADIRLYLAPMGSDLSSEKIEADLFVGTKLDEAAGEASADFDICVSAKTGENLDALKSRLEEMVLTLTQTQEAPGIVRQRHQIQLSTAIEALKAAEWKLSEEDDVDLAAFELSIARSALDQILGRVDVEDILGEIFAGFCVGK